VDALQFDNVVGGDWFSERLREQNLLLEVKVTGWKWGKMKIARGSELSEKSVKMINKGEMAVAWSQEMK
jgi:hypothetical protein